MPDELSCTAAVDPAYALEGSQFTTQELYDDNLSESSISIRRYVISYTKQRLHQSVFREKVINAYKEHWALCALKHRSLLDAAHIIPDSAEHGDAIVQNGLSLCKIHHAAYDQNILGVTPDYTIKIRSDILEEIDGPMLRYGLQELNNGKIYIPSAKNDRPDKNRLSVRYEKFKSAS